MIATARAAAATGLAVAIALPLLGGCTAGIIAAQVVPAAMGTVAIANSEDRSPFRIQNLDLPARTGADLAALDARILDAECGDPFAQYWLAAALRDGFNATPDEVEIYKWLRLAERGGVTAARAPLAELDARLSRAQIAQANARAEHWHARTEGCPARG